MNLGLAIKKKISIRISSSGSHHKSNWRSYILFIGYYILSYEQSTILAHMLIYVHLVCLSRNFSCLDNLVIKYKLVLLLLLWN